MSSVMEGVNQRTQLAGHNRMELLMFHLGDAQRYGINVFKVQEVIRCPRLTHVPNSHPTIRGIANIRGKTLPVIDLAMSIGKPAVTSGDGNFLIVTEYNNSIQGFLVSGVERIVNMNWEDIKPPPQGMGPSCYLTAVTNVDNGFVEIIDVEKVLAEVNHAQTDVSDELAQHGHDMIKGDEFILVVDDSRVARKQIVNPLEQMGIQNVTAANGREALDLLKKWATDGHSELERLMMVISDVEMPFMDGYTLTTEIRKDPALRHLHVILHTSLSGGFNKAMVEKVGANCFIPKYDPDILSGAVIEYLDQLGKKPR